ncbi:MAG: prepilin-type N-terminal cleavage/methylation domain-containing protein [Candidatus Omnitrophica bacterium]|nr:prepilin-type N-terminal cleavage/methylation domain-containing protein [Candidatus Omnitrophota bacterium]
MKKNAGFTLVEVLVAGSLLAVATLGALSLFGYFLSSSEFSNNLTCALYEAHQQMENLSRFAYTVIRDGGTEGGVSLPAYTNNGQKRETPFILTNLNGSGTVYAEELPPTPRTLMRIKLVVCFRQGQRVIGEDSNLNGRLDAGEDVNGNGELDSPISIEKVIVNRLI